MTEQSSSPTSGDWSGVYVGNSSRLSIDHAVLAYGGGVSRIPGSSVAFNTIELHQAESARITNSIIEESASGLGGIGDEFDDRRGGAGSHDAGAIFVRGTPMTFIVNNTIRGTQGTNAGAISIDVVSTNDDLLVDPGRSRGGICLLYTSDAADE